MNDVKRTERGWGAHLCVNHHCAFRRNTLLECGDVRMIVSSVGGYMRPKVPGLEPDDKATGFSEIGCGRYYETMCFHAQWDGRYWDADVHREASFDAPFAVRQAGADDVANIQHEQVVDEISRKLAEGWRFEDESATPAEESREGLRL